MIGDRKTPTGWNHGSARYQPYGATSFEFSRHAPDNHYARKNLGYLLALHYGAEIIYETDDDNLPNTNWSERQQVCLAEPIEKKGWCNAYRYFSGANIWPRGLPLKYINEFRTPTNFNQKELDCPIQQGLADGSPDVDAIWRLVIPKDSFRSFTIKWDVALEAGTWCPFNSQSTWWWPEAFPLMYLPINATFRMTDIWRSLVAQRCLWAMGKRVAFHSPAEVHQERNPHDLMRDFEDEIQGYLQNDRIAALLQNTGLKPGTDIATVCDNLRLCYTVLWDKGIFPAMECTALDAWIADVKKLRGVQ